MKSLIIFLAFTTAVGVASANPPECAKIEVDGSGNPRWPTTHVGEQDAKPHDYWDCKKVLELQASKARLTARSKILESELLEIRRLLTVLESRSK